MNEYAQRQRPLPWWDHLRAQAVAGISHFERAVEFEEGQSGYRAVTRQGWRVWVNWACIHFWAGVGCLLIPHRSQTSCCMRGCRHWSGFGL